MNNLFFPSESKLFEVTLYREAFNHGPDGAWRVSPWKRSDARTSARRLMMLMLKLTFSSSVTRGVGSIRGMVRSQADTYMMGADRNVLMTIPDVTCRYIHRALTGEDHGHPSSLSATHHFQLHVVVSGVDGHAGRGGEHPVQEGKVGKAGVVGARAVHTHVQNFHQVFADQRHHQAAEKAGWEACTFGMFHDKQRENCTLGFFISIHIRNNPTYSLAVIRRIKATPVSRVNFLSWPTCSGEGWEQFKKLNDLALHLNWPELVRAVSRNSP